MRFGGNTPCVEVRTGDGCLLILDAGTGVRRLGARLEEDGPPLHLLVTHLHLDHVEGLRFFAPFWHAERELHIWGPPSPQRPKVLGEDTIRSRKAWKIELQAWGTSSQYGVARLWIDQESGALLRIEGYNREGKLLRRFEVISAQKIDGQWMLKQMRVETLDPESNKILNRTYLEVLGKSGATS